MRRFVCERGKTPLALLSDEYLLDCLFFNSTQILDLHLPASACTFFRHSKRDKPPTDTVGAPPRRNCKRVSGLKIAPRKKNVDMKSNLDHMRKVG